jgi:hypothetical protein
MHECACEARGMCRSAVNRRGLHAISIEIVNDPAMREEL